MRNFLRKYLGIVDPINEAIPFDHKQGIDETELNEKKIQACVEEAIGALFEEGTLPFYGFSALRSKMENLIVKAVSEKAEKAAKDAISSKVDGEAFIDEVVARIRNKQLL